MAVTGTAAKKPTTPKNFAPTSIAIMVMTLPVMFPIMVSVGYDPIWLGVISIKLAEISLMTPPVGLNVYVVRSASPVPLTLEQVFAGVMPFLAMDLITLTLLIAFMVIAPFIEHSIRDQLPEATQKELSEPDQLTIEIGAVGFPDMGMAAEQAYTSLNYSQSSALVASGAGT